MIVEIPDRWMFMSDAEIREWQKARRVAKGEPEPPTMEECGRRLAQELEQRLLTAIRKETD